MEELCRFEGSERGRRGAFGERAWRLECVGPRGVEGGEGGVGLEDTPRAGQIAPAIHLTEEEPSFCLQAATAFLLLRQRERARVASVDMMEDSGFNGGSKARLPVR